MTLDRLYTQTILRPAERDEIWHAGRPAKCPFAQRAIRFLDLLRKQAGSTQTFRVETENNFPTGAGLASSASGFAALALAGSRALNLELTDRQLSTLARQGSGSAARSIFGGFVEWHRGVAPDGQDSFAETIASESHWDVRMLVAITSDEEKSQSSTEGMNLTRDTSPYYDAWVSHSETALSPMRRAIIDRDLTQVGEQMEASCLRMHAVMMSAAPGLLYWNSTTVELIHTVRRLRKSGVEAYFTIDAGPQVKVLHLASDSSAVQRRVAEVPGVLRTLQGGPGPAATLREAT